MAALLLAYQVARTDVRKVLDVGCSMGYALEAARRLGFDATGIDVSDYAVEECRRRGYKAKVADIAETGFPNASFQLATLTHVLEHTRTPKRSIQEMARILAPGGGIYVSVPYAGYWKARLLRYSHRFFHPRAHAREHHFYLTRKALRHLLETNGFEAVRFGRGLILTDALLTGKIGLPTEMVRYLISLFRDVFFVDGCDSEMVAVARKKA